MTIPSQALNREGVTTIESLGRPRVSRVGPSGPKRKASHWDDDIVFSIWKHIAVLNKTGRGSRPLLKIWTLLPTHTTGTDDGTADYLCNDATAQTGSSITVDTGTGTFKKGDIIYINNVLRVHPETKASTGLHQPFVVTADVAASATSIPISPEIIVTGGRQNVNAGAANNAPIHKVESDNRATLTSATDIGNAADYRISLGFCRDAFVFATADLEMPRGVHFAARKVMDGVSMRIVSAYDINNDNMPTRVDVLYGYKTVRPELAVRYGFN